MQKTSKIFLLLMLILGLSCRKKPETQKEYLQRALKDRIAKHVEEKKENCNKKLNEKAAEIADSILLQEALVIDSIQAKLPVVPPKPAFIDPKPIADSLPVQPFLKNEPLDTRKDTSSVER